MDPLETKRVFGGGEFLYEVDPAWPPVPEDWGFHEVAGVATDSQDRECVFNRGEHTVMEQDEILRMVFEGGLAAAGTAGLFKVHPATVSRLLVRQARKVSRKPCAPNKVNGSPPLNPESDSE